MSPVPPRISSESTSLNPSRREIRLRQLILWRHAEAEDGHVGMDDLQRQLTKVGRKQAEKMATWLHRRMPAATVIYASPARRTCQTADALELPYSVANAIAPDATPQALLQTALDCAADEVLLVGHQPTLGRLAAMLLSGTDQDWSVKKGAIWWFTLSNWHPDGTSATVRLKACLTAEMA